MLTQMEFLGTDDDGSLPVSPIDDLSDYSIKQTDFEYFEAALPNDLYYQVPEKHDFSVSFPQSTTPTTVLTAAVYDPTSYDNTIVLYDDYMEPFGDDANTFASAIKTELEDHPFEEVKPDLSDFGFEEEASSNDGFSGSGFNVTADDTHSLSLNFGSLQDSISQDLNMTETKQVSTTRNWEEGGGKGKISPLQRRALDDIFSVTDKPSRGLVLHIASELGLHHLTVKNFFSNARRRLRRAAARLSDPERTKRENERRKEKRRLAALASAALASGVGKAPSSLSPKASTPRTPPAESPPPKESSVVSPERRALMEKLADKVQRSVAQRTMAADLDLLRNTSTSQPSQTTQANHTNHQANHTNQTTNTFTLQPTHDILLQSPNDLLSQASHDILAESARELLGSPHDFLSHPSHVLDSDSSSSTTLHSQNDPWSNLF